MRDSREDGFKQALQNRAMWGKMRMMPTDIEDVQGFAPLINGMGTQQNWTGIFKPGEKVRLRLINSSAMTYFDVRIPGLKMTVVQADGNDVKPVAVDELRISVAETYDVIVQPREAKAYGIIAESMGRTAMVRGSLSPTQGYAGLVPRMRPQPLLTMADMGGMMDGMDMGGMDMGGMDHSAMTMSSQSSTMPEDMDHSKMDMSGDMEGMDHSKMDMSGDTTAVDHSKMDMSGDMKAVDHSKMDMSGSAKAVDHSKMDMSRSMKGMDHSKMDMSVGMAGMNHSARDSKIGEFYAPGSGLIPSAANGGKFLSYNDLKAARPLYRDRPATRTIELRLTGNMERYIWSINGVKMDDAAPIRLKYGERVRFKFVNETMMSHPMHLHGMWSILDTGKGKWDPIKHTVSIAPGTTVYTETEVDATGQWAFHCHLSYHAEAGMFRKVIVEGGPA